MGVSADQAKDLQASWGQVASNLDKHSVDFLHSYFAKHQDFLVLFNNINMIPLDQMKGDDRFKMYCSKVFKDLGEIIGHAGDAAALKKDLDYLGSSHKPRKVAVSHFETMLVMLKQYLKDNTSNCNEGSWQAFSDELLSVIKPHLA